MPPTATPIGADHPASSPDHPQHSIWAGITAALAHILSLTPQAFHYAEDALQLGIAAGVKVNPKVALGLAVAEGVAGEIDKIKADHAAQTDATAPTEPAPTTEATKQPEL